MTSRCNFWVALLLLASCATKPPARTTWTEPPHQARPGVIESVNKIEERVTSNASENVILGIFVGGLLLSGLLLPYGSRSIIGAEDGSSAIASHDGTSTALPRYQVLIRFDDGGSMTLVYTNDVAFHRGERVVLTQQGLVAAEAKRPKVIAHGASAARTAGSQAR
ncbi:MAG TPA: hypothetical protein VM513_20415 [Kofleriaceae bacterium]|nr:hypothetical protein [Kofleriaceae bacterium]